jgi:hypothetical protein
MPWMTLPHRRHSHVIDGAASAPAPTYLTTYLTHTHKLTPLNPHCTHIHPALTHCLKEQCPVQQPHLPAAAHRPVPSRRYLCVLGVRNVHLILSLKYGKTVRVINLGCNPKHIPDVSIPAPSPPSPACQPESWLGCQLPTSGGAPTALPTTALHIAAAPQLFGIPPLPPCNSDTPQLCQLPPPPQPPHRCRRTPPPRRSAATPHRRRPPAPPRLTASPRCALSAARWARQRRAARIAGP